MSQWSFSQEFYAGFQSVHSDLETRIKSTTLPVTLDALQNFSNELVELTRRLLDATGSLPAYDQQQCQSQLDALEKRLDELRSSSAPKPKFSFKRKGAKSPITASNLTEFKVATAMDHPIPLVTSVEITTRNLAISSRSHCYVTLASLPDSFDSSYLTISDLDHCIVDLLSPTCNAGNDEEPHQRKVANLSALQVYNIHNSILCLPVIAGSVLLHDVSSCVIIVGCHQFRMHNSQEVDVYLQSPSNAVIENARRIRFAPYSDVVANDTQKSNGDFAVDDFSHIRTTTSPNWSILTPQTRPEMWLPSMLRGDGDVASMLEAYLPHYNQ